METGVVFNLQKYSVQDGPGIRTTVFLKGCPLNCVWCHNPESQSAHPELTFSECRCLGCGECRRACSQAAARPSPAPLPPQPVECTTCGQCVQACPTEARQLVGRRWTVAEVLAEIAKDGIFYDQSAGGVTFSGGEPLAQPTFLKALLVACRRRGLRTAVDTCGFASERVLLDVARLTDLILFDLKLMDDAKHRHYTGVSNVPILANLRALGQLHDNLWLRLPLIPGVNDDADHLAAVARLAASLPGVRQISVLPYHKLGAEKARRLGMEAPLPGVEPPSAAQVERVVAQFRAHGLNAKAGA